MPVFIVEGMSIISNMYCGLPRNDGGSEKLNNSIGFSERVLAENAGIPSIQN